MCIAAVAAAALLCGCAVYVYPQGADGPTAIISQPQELTGREGQADTKAELEYWAENSAPAQSIREYVENATDPASDKYVPAEDRIAVFDLDGTIIGELYPSYFEYMMFVHRALHDDTYEAPEDMKEFALAMEEGFVTGKMPENCERLHARYAGQSYAGMTIDEFKAYTREFMESEADGFTNLTRGEAFYWPMVSLVKYLDANDFQVYIVSGSDRNLIRGLIKDILPVPENRVIGMTYNTVATGQGDTDGLDYLYTADDEVLLGGDLIIKTIKMNKVSIIAEEIGKVPVLAFGNSSGDLSMGQYVENNDQYEGRAYMVLCDDLEREHGNLDKAYSLRDFCVEHDFETISMRDDFATIYGDDVTITPYSFEEQAPAEESNILEFPSEAVQEAAAEPAGTEEAAAEAAAETEAAQDVAEEAAETEEEAADDAA